MHFIRIVFMLAVAVVLIYGVGCSKSESPKDTEKPVMTVSLPTHNQVITLSLDSMHILLNISDNDKLKSFAVELKSTAGTTLYTDSPADVNGKNYYNYHRHFNPPGVTGNMDAVLTLNAQDNSGNSDSKTINISFSP